METKLRQRSIVARSAETLDPEKILSRGFEQMERALDIAAYENKVLDRLSDPRDQCWILYNRHHDFVLRYFDLWPDVIKVYSEIKALDKNEY